MMSGIKLKGQNGLFTPASFSHIYRLKTTQMSNDKGTWFGWEVSKLGSVADTRCISKLKRLVKIFLKEVSKLNMALTNQKGLTRISSFNRLVG